MYFENLKKTEKDQLFSAIIMIIIISLTIFYNFKSAKSIKNIFFNNIINFHKETLLLLF